MSHNDIANLIKAALHIVEFNLGEFEPELDVELDFCVGGLLKFTNEDWKSLEL